MENKLNFSNVGLLITHYNRSSSLARLLETFDSFNFDFGQIVVSDDGSEPRHQKKILELKEKYHFDYITDTNKGLGNNINKGEDLIKTPYTLYVQEDFYPKPLFRDIFKSSLEFMETNGDLDVVRYGDLDVVRYYAYSPYPSVEDYKNGFSKMKFKCNLPGYRKFYYYSDHPHLRRSSFSRKFGRYAEGHNPEQTEYRMMISFLKNKGQGLFYLKHRTYFIMAILRKNPAPWRGVHCEKAIIQLLPRHDMFTAM